MIMVNLNLMSQEIETVALSSLRCGVVASLGRLQVLTDLHNRRVQDILVASVDAYKK